MEAYQSLSVKPNYAEAFNNMGIASRARQARRSNRGLQQALSIKSDYTDAYNMVLLLKVLSLKNKWTLKDDCFSA